MLATVDAAVERALIMYTKVSWLTPVPCRMLRADKAGLKDAPAQQKPYSEYQWLHVQPNHCSYQYSIVYADEDVVSRAFAYEHMFTTGRLSLGLATDASNSLWLTGVDRIGPVSAHRDRSDVPLALWPTLLSSPVPTCTGCSGTRKRYQSVLPAAMIRR
jgi:hypothetical protein